MTKIDNHRRRVILAMLLACPLAAYFALPHPANYAVAARARKLAVVTDWLPVRLAGNAPYQWLSDRELIIQHSTRPAAILDISTGHERPLTALALSVRRSPDIGRLSGQGPPDWCVSPNGQWLLTYGFAAGKPTWTVSTLDGAHTFDFPASSPNPMSQVALRVSQYYHGPMLAGVDRDYPGQDRTGPMWSYALADHYRRMALRARRPEWPLSRGPIAMWDCDSRGFVQIDSIRSNYSARHYLLPVALCTGQFAPSDPRKPAADTTTISLGSVPDEPGGMFYPLGEMADGTILLADLFGGDRRGAALRACSLTGALQTNRVLQIPLGANIVEGRLSPDGKRLAWIFDFSGRAYDGAARRLPFSSQVPGHSAGEVWASNVDGTGMHAIAVGNNSCTGPRFLRWTPDSKSVTFVYQRCLYISSAQ